MTRPRLLLVFEHVLGHVSYARTLERAAQRMPELEASVLRIRPRPSTSPPPPWLRSWSLEASWYGRRAVLDHLRTRPADAIYFHTQALTLFAAGIMRRVPSVISLDATPANYDELARAYAHPRQAAAVEAAKRAWYRRAFRRAAAFHAWSGWVERSLREDYEVEPGRIHQIPAGVDLALFSPRARRDGGPLRLLFVGGDFERKGGGALVEAIRGIESPVQLDVVTSAGAVVPGRPGVRVHRGLTPESEALAALYRQADIFILPTLGDSYGLAVLEAAASGLPVITTRVGGLAEMLQDGRDAILVEPGQPRPLRQALEGLIADPSRRRALGRAARRLAEGRFDAERNNRRVLGLLAGVAMRATGDTAGFATRQGVAPR